MSQRTVPSIPAMRWLLACSVALVAACGNLPQRDGAPAKPFDPSRVADAVPRAEPRSKYGNPASYRVLGRTYKVLDDASGYVERGIASWYGAKFHGKRTSSGEPYDMYAMTAAHRELPLPSYVQVTHLGTGKSVIVRVNDRGPFHKNRLIDLSYAAAVKLGITHQGFALVEVRAIDPEKRDEQAQSVPRQSASASLYLQLGAFADRQTAERLRDKVRGFEVPVRIEEAAADRGTLYRVRLGPLPSVEAAHQWTARLAQMGLGNAVVQAD